MTNPLDALFSTPASGLESSSLTPQDLFDRSNDLAYIAQQFERADYPMIEPAGVEKAWKAFSLQHGEAWLPPQLFDSDAIITTIITTLLSK